MSDQSFEDTRIWWHVYARDVVNNRRGTELSNAFFHPQNINYVLDSVTAHMHRIHNCPNLLYPDISAFQAFRDVANSVSRTENTPEIMEAINTLVIRELYVKVLYNYNRQVRYGVDPSAYLRTRLVVDRPGPNRIPKRDRFELRTYDHHNARPQPSNPGDVIRRLLKRYH